MGWQVRCPRCKAPHEQNLRDGIEAEDKAEIILVCN